MRFDEVVRRLAEVRQDALPGVSAQAAMSPRPRRPWRSDTVPRAAAGLVLLFPKGEEAHLLLTVRGAHLATHQGQVSLPGGAVEPGESIEEAALREAEEEVGVDRARLAIRFRLTPLPIPVSGYVLNPVVATTDGPVLFTANAREVDRIVEWPLSRIASDGPRRESRKRDGVAIEVPYFAVEREKLWGATAMVIAELMAVLGEPIRYLP